MTRVATTVRVDRRMRDMLETIGKAKGLAINAIVTRALAAYVDRESRLLERDLSGTLERIRAYRADPAARAAAVAAIVADEGAYPDPAEADQVYHVDSHPVEASVLAALDERLDEA